MFSGLLFVSFVKMFVCFCKAENIVIYILIHTIQLSFFSQFKNCTHFFYGFAYPTSWKIEAQLNAIDVSLVPCIVK